MTNGSISIQWKRTVQCPMKHWGEWALLHSECKWKGYRTSLSIDDGGLDCNGSLEGEEKWVNTNMCVLESLLEKKNVPRDAIFDMGLKTSIRPLYLYSSKKLNLLLI